LRRAIKAGIAGLMGLVTLGTAYAVDPDRAMSQYVREHWGAEQGFPKGPVYAIAQTPDGYLWIGADAGLIRFDGWNFRLVTDDSGAFTITSVLGLTTDHDGSLWLRLQDLTILRYRNGVFDRPSGYEPLLNISAMSRANGGQLLIAEAEVGALLSGPNGFQMLASASDLPRSPIISLAQTANGDIWMGSRDAGLFRFAGGKALSIKEGLPDYKVNCLLPAGDRDLWVGTDSGIVRWNGAELTSAGIAPSSGRFQALTMARDRDGNIWVGTDSHGLLRFNSHGLASLQENDGVLNGAVTALFEGREGNLWIGGANGIERLRDSAFITYSNPEGLPADGSNPLYVDAEQRLWFPPLDGGLWWVRGAERGRIRSDGLDRDVVYSIAGGNQELWVGRQRGGLTQVRTGNGAFTTKTYTHANGLAEDSVYSVYVTRDGIVWAGTLSAGVSRFREGEFTTYTTANGLAANTVASILESRDGTMWFATPSGLNALSKDRWRTYTGRDGLPSDNVNCLLEDSKGVLWAGTADGLAFLGSGGFHVPGHLPAPFQAQILGMADDRHGSLWMATSNQVLRVNRDKLLGGALSEGDVREYGLADGLRGVEGVKRHSSVSMDSSGRIWFSLNHGISVVDPARLKRNAAPAIAHVQGISADGHELRLTKALHIPGGNQRITVEYVGLSLTDPANVRYRYFLDGFDRDWSGEVSTREAVYTNLPPGSYRFRVVASNPDGVWSNQEAVASFEVDPLFWQTQWFRFSVVLICAAAVLSLYRFRLHQLTSGLNSRFQERLAERTRIAQDLHDTLLQGFLSASMQVHVATDRLPEDSPVKPGLTRALELMRQVIDEGRNALRGLRSPQSFSLDLEHAFSRIQQELAQEHGAGQVEFRVIVDGTQRPLHPVLRDEVYRIGREALVNAFHHARAQRIEIELKYSAANLRVRVRDDGSGIDPDILRAGRDGHWGLSGMRERANSIGARLHVFSSPSAGTEVDLLVPGHLAFQDQPRLWAKWLGTQSRDRSNGKVNKNGDK
jgi:ligand-binding sensor domain-containing protein/signal transduction histidine kinase